jgi:ABC-2 type transport system ATP-binding protein
MTAARLALSEVTVDFGGVRALDHVDLDVEPGAIVGLIGPNGSGKTTLLDVVSGMVAPTGGTVTVDGRDLADDLPEDRAGIGVVRSFQDCRLFPELSVEDTLLLTPDARSPVSVLATTFGLPAARRSEREKRAQVAGVVESFGLTRFRGHRIGELSTGTRRVVDLASIILAGPRLLLLDEPTASIDPATAREVRAHIQRIASVGGGGILWTSHNMYEVEEVCDRVLFLSHGRILLEGDPRTLPREHGAHSLEELFIRLAREPLHTSRESP